MPIHNWKSVESGIFHGFHQVWSTRIMESLNRVLPSDHYAIVEQNATLSEKNRFEPDVVTLRSDSFNSSTAGVALGSPPQTSRRVRDDLDAYASKKNIVSVRHVTGDEIVAIVELVSPGNKSSFRDMRQFVAKIEQLLRRGIHVLLVDLFPPSKTNPNGLHEAIWDHFDSRDPEPMAPARPLMTMSYENHGQSSMEAYLEALSVGGVIPSMPVFLECDGCVMVPLEETYNSAYAAMPERLKSLIEAGTPPATSPD